MKAKFTTAALLSSFGLTFLFTSNAFAAQYIFPVLGSSSYTNDYTSPRSNGQHNAIDIIANKHQPVVSAADGTVERVFSPQPSWGYSVVIKSTGGYCYWYIHLNNDNPGTDDGKGGEMKAYAADMNAGNAVKRGQLVGWVGDSGNAESTVSHLHFEVVKAENGRCGSTSGTHINPYNSLVAAQRISRPVVYPPVAGELLPFGATYKGEVNVARGDLNQDGQEEIVIAAGKGGGPKVSIYSSSGQLLVSFYAFSSTTLRNGTDVAVGDVDGDGRNELVATSQIASGEQVSTYDISDQWTQTLVRTFSVPAETSPTTSRIALGDVDSDLTDEIIIGGGPGGSPSVWLYEADGTLIRSQLVYDAAFSGGVDVASGNVSGLLADEIVVAPRSIGSSRVQVFDGDFTKLSEFFAYSTTFRGGVALSVGNVQTGSLLSEIVTLPQTSGPQVRVLNANGSQQQSQFYMESWWKGRYDIAAGNGRYDTATGGNRRGSVR